jgi:hypothetical protein
MNTPFKAHNTETHEKALRAFRRRHQLKRLRSAAQLCALLVLGACWLTVRQIPASKETLVANTPPTSLSASTASLDSPPEPRSLTDEELIAKFPPGSCFMAEVNGKKILVFKDPQVEKQFFQ